IGAAGEVDSFVLNLDAGQTLSFWADSVSALAPSIAVLEPGGGTIATIAAAAGQTALLNTVTVAAAGNYTLTVTGASGTTGAYTLDGFLNAFAEPESLVGGNNNTTAASNSMVAESFAWGVPETNRLALVGWLDVATSDYF